MVATVANDIDNAGAAPAAPVLVQIPVGDIEPHPDNPRTFPAQDDSDTGLMELAESIGEVGLLEPVLVRPLAEPGDMGGLPQRYQLVAGERRWRACRLAGLERIPAIVRELDDRQALEVLVTENLQREDLSPIEEARGVRALIDRGGWTVQDVADRLGRSLHWVAQRARLTELSPAWLKAVADPNRDVSRWPASSLVEIARLDPSAQDEFDRQFGITESGLDVEPVDSNWLRKEVANMLRKLSAATWKLDDAGLHPNAGACTACHKRSSCHPGLFEDEDLERPAKTDRCLDAVCWAEEAVPLPRGARGKPAGRAQEPAPGPRRMVRGDGARPRSQGCCRRLRPAAGKEDGSRRGTGPRGRRQGRRNGAVGEAARAFTVRSSTPEGERRQAGGAAVEGAPRGARAPAQGQGG